MAATVAGIANKTIFKNTRNEITVGSKTEAAKKSTVLLGFDMSDIFSL
jgi:hypothetical protein